MGKRKRCQLQLEESLESLKEIDIFEIKNQFESNCKKISSDVLTNKDKGVLSEISNGFGIYMFEINILKLSEKKEISKDYKSLIEIFSNKWQEEGMESYPMLVEGRVEKLLGQSNISEKEFIPLYIGKSEKLHKRIKEHLFIKSESKTYALKLSSRNLGVEYKLRYADLSPYINNNTKFLLKEYEAILIDDYNPIVGRV